MCSATPTRGIGRKRTALDGWAGQVRGPHRIEEALLSADTNQRGAETRNHTEVDTTRRLIGSPAYEAAHSQEASQASWRRVYLATACFLIATEAILLYWGSFLTWPPVLLILLLVFARRGEKLQFVRDFGPLLLVVLAYFAMWGAADDLGGALRITPQIEAERFLFGGRIPTIVLQDAFYNPADPHWYDYLAVFAHISHFILPVLFAAVIWQHYRHLHVRFISTFVLLFFAGFLTFLIIPSAPPWWASDAGYLDKVYLVHDTVPGLPHIYVKLSPNPVAAIPSLHAAFPWLVLLFSFKLWGRRALPMAVYPLCIWWSIVYTGHHYVVDVIAGAIYATAVYYLLCGQPYRLARRAFDWAWRRTPAPAIEPRPAPSGSPATVQPE